MSDRKPYQYATKPGQWTGIEKHTAKNMIEDRYTQTHTAFLLRQLDAGRVVELDSLGVKQIRRTPER